MRNSSLAVSILLGVSLFLPIEQAAPQLVTEKQSSAPTESSATSHKTVLFIGDSLTEGYGVKKEEAYPEVVGRILEKKGRKVRIVNGGISGSVTADADRRLRWFLKSKPDVLVLALGGNDALKGTPTESIRKNLARAIDAAKTEKIPVLLCGIRIFSNFGADYGQALDAVYRDLARERKVSLVPFLLEGVALKKELNQSDGKHPNAKGHEVIAYLVARELEKLL